MANGERGIIPIALTTFNPGKEYWPSRGSNQQPAVIKSTTLLIELWGSVELVKTMIRKLENIGKKKMLPAL